MRERLGKKKDFVEFLQKKQHRKKLSKKKKMMIFYLPHSLPLTHPLVRSSGQPLCA